MSMLSLFGGSRIVRFDYDSASRVVGAHLEVVGDSVTRWEPDVLFERFGDRGVMLLPAAFEAILPSLDGDPRLARVSLVDASGSAFEPRSMEWITGPRFYEPHLPAPSELEFEGIVPAVNIRWDSSTTFRLAAATLDKPPKNERERACWFWFAFDAQTQDRLSRLWRQINPIDRISEHELEFRSQAIREMGAMLARRLGMRQRAGIARREGRRVEPVSSGDEPRAGVTAYLSRLQLEVFDRYYPLWRRGVDESGLGAAFEWFAAGVLSTCVYPPEERLRYPVPDAAPDGPLVMMFAEFAMYAIECGVDASAWARLLPHLNAMQAIYHRAYGDVSLPIRLADFHGKLKLQQIQQVQSADLERIRAERRVLRNADPRRLAAEIGVQVGDRMAMMFSDDYQLGMGTAYWTHRLDRDES